MDEKLNNNVNYWLVSFVVIATYGGLVIGDEDYSQIQTNNGTTNSVETVSSKANTGPKIQAIPCSNPSDCKDIDGTYCDADIQMCLCKPDYPVTDTKQCYKVSKFDEFCQLDIQCQRRDKNTKCNHDFNLCECQSRYIAKSYSKGQHWCVEPNKSQKVLDTSIGSHVDYTTLGIMAGLALMFIVICVVLQLFAKAQFAENRSIFNTPNPRLMNVSLLKDRDLENSTTQASTRRRSQNQKYRKTSSSVHSTSAAVTAKPEGSNPQQPASEVKEEDQILIEMKDSQA